MVIYHSVIVNDVPKLSKFFDNSYKSTRLYSEVS